MAGHRVGRGVSKPCKSCQSNCLRSAHFVALLLPLWIITPPSLGATYDDIPEFLEQPTSQIISHHAPVTLLCDVTPEDAQIRWLFNDQPLDHRRHKGLHVIGSNLHFNHLSHGRGNHSNDGEYRCTATTAAGTIVSRPAHLSKPVLGHFNGTRNDVTMSVPEGGYATLTCDPPESSPRSDIKFIREDGTVLDTSRGPYRRLPSGNVIITDVTAHTVGHFRCVAVNPVSGRNVTSPSVIRVMLAPAPQDGTQQVFILPRETTQVQVEVHNEVVLECPSYGLRSGGNVTWSKYGGSLPLGRSQVTEFGNLKIQATEYQDTGTYKCNIQPPHDTLSSSSSFPSSSFLSSSSSMEAIVSLEILTAPTVVVLRSPGDVEEGEKVSLACSVQGFPQPVTQWFHNGRKIVTSPPGQKGEEELVLTEASLADSGIYQCMATNKLGTAYGVMEMLVVAGEEDEEEDDLMGELDEFDTDEEIESFLNGGNKQNNKKKTGRRDRKKHGRRRNMRLNSDRNKNKKKKGEKPKYAPTIPLVTQLSDRSVMLNWTVPDKGNGQTIKFFKVQFREFSPTKGVWQTVDDMLAPDDRRYEVKGLKSRGWYKFRILAVYEDNDNKNSPSTELFKLSLQQHFQPKQPDTPPTIVKAEPLVHNNNFGLGIQWQYNAESASPIEGFVILYREHDSEQDYLEVELPGPGIRHHVIRDLRPNTNYEIRVKSFNIVGRSHVSNKVVSMTKPAALAGQYDPLTPPQRQPDPPFNNNPVLVPPPYGGPSSNGDPSRKPYPEYADPYGGGLTDQPPANEDHRRSNSSEVLDQPVILGIVLGALVLVLLIMVAMCWWKQQQHKRNNMNSNNPHKFQDQAQCIYSDVAGNPTLTKPPPTTTTPTNSAGSVSGGGLYPQVSTNMNGGPPHLPHNGHGPRLGSTSHHGHPLNMEVNPLAEYDLQNSMAHIGDGRKPGQFYGNGVGSNPQPYPHSASSDSLDNPHQPKNHNICNGGADMNYGDDCPGGSSMYPMKHRTLPLTPAPPMASSYYSEANSGSLGRHGVNHDYSEPATEHLHHQLYHHQLPSGSNSHSSGLRHSPNQLGPHHFVPTNITHPSNTGDHYEWSYDQPRGGVIGVGNKQEMEMHQNRVASLERGLSPCYPIMADFAGDNPAMHLPPPTRIPPGYTGVGMAGREMGYREHGKHKRRRKRLHSGERVNREHGGMKDQATNTDLSSNEGTFDFTTFCKSGSSCSNSGSDPGDGGGGCDSSFANNGSLESLDDSHSASSHDCQEMEPFRLPGRVAPL